MEEENKEDENRKTENFDLIEPLNLNSAKSSLISNKESEPKKKNGCHFPTAYTVLLIIELLVFILTYIVPKGLYYKIEYSEDKGGVFIITYQNDTTNETKAEQSVLDYYNIKIPLESFEKGYIKKPISIPGTYERIKGEKTNFFYLFLYPLLGLIDSADISVFLFVLGGILNILIEMNALSGGLTALARITKGKEFLLVILVFIIISIGGSIFGLLEEILAFYPILMPVFLKNGVDGMLGAAPLYLGSMMGNMFSTINAFTVVLGSYSAGISFINGIAFRFVAFILGDILTILYMYYYYKKVKEDEKNSAVYDIKKEIYDQCIKDTKKEDKKEESEKNDETNEEKVALKGDTLEEQKDKEEEDKKEKFGWKQKIALIIFMSGFGIMIFGVMVLDWWFEHMAAVFLGFSIILIVLLGRGEYKGIEVFVKGAGDFVGVSMIIGIARGINITLEEGKISDTLLNALSNGVSGFPKIIFAVLMLIIFMVLGILISSSTGLAILAMPIFSPLADEVNLARKVVVNTYMFGQYYAGIVTPTGLVLIALQMVGIPYNYWIKFIWPYMIIFLVFLVILIIVDVLIEG